MLIHVKLDWSIFYRLYSRVSRDHRVGVFFSNRNCLRTFLWQIQEILQQHNSSPHPPCPVNAGGGVIFQSGDVKIGQSPSSGKRREEINPSHGFVSIAGLEPKI